jgi:cardiolipin synthase
VTDPQCLPRGCDDIAQAQHFILFENYIFRSDRIGNQIAEALMERARAGIEVYVLFDWLGSLGTSRTLWVKMQRAGVRVRALPIDSLCRTRCGCCSATTAR